MINNEKSAQVGESASTDMALKDLNTIPFRLSFMLQQGGKARTAVFLWFCLCLIIVPSSMVTRFLDWTGIELTLGSMSFYVTIYVPMLFCVPLVFWFGYLWAAIPAYLSTFVVGYLGGMPIEWLVVFSFANPLSLGLYTLSYRVMQVKPGMSNLVSFVGFSMVALVASLAGSVGAFIWAYTNQVGLNESQLVWQGWWVGGWLQAMLFALPILHFANPYVDKWCASLKQGEGSIYTNYKLFAIATTVFALVLVGYVISARFISVEQLNSLSQSLSEQADILSVQNAIDGMTYPLYILLTVMIALVYLIYKAVIYWHQALLEANDQLKSKNKELEKLATTDYLSSLYNRRFALEFAQSEFERTLRTQQTVSVLMVDIDKFKNINDTLGHLVGDKVIKTTATRLVESLRPYDVAGRYGGEEFIVILPQTSIEDAASIAERILASISLVPVTTDKGPVKVTVSIGVSTIQTSDTHSEATIERADQGLLLAKESGRNCIKKKLV